MQLLHGQPPAPAGQQNDFSGNQMSFMSTRIRSPYRTHRRTSARAALRAALLPALLPALLAVLPLAAHPANAQSLPEPRQVISKYLEAVGGAESLRTVKSIRQVGVVEMASMGITGEAVNLSAVPSRAVMKTTIPGIGDLINGTNGIVGWSVNPMEGPRLLEDRELNDAIEGADFQANLLVDIHNFSSMENCGLVDFAGEKAYEIALIREGSGNKTTHYFSKATGLLIGTKMTRKTAKGSLTSLTALSDYKRFGGILFPTHNEVTVGPTRIVLTVREVTLNDISDEAFLPPAILNGQVRK